MPRPYRSASALPGRAVPARSRQRPPCRTEWGLTRSEPLCSQVWGMGAASRRAMCSGSEASAALIEDENEYEDDSPETGSAPIPFATEFARESNCDVRVIGRSTWVADPGRPRPGVGDALLAETARSASGDTKQRKQQTPGLTPGPAPISAPPKNRVPNRNWSRPRQSADLAAARTAA